MVYSHENKYIFIRCPKTGSRSIQWILRHNCQGVNGRAPHMHPTAIMDQLGMDCWNEYFKFVFVRNPWDHFVSIWFWYKHRKDIPESMTLKELASNATTPGYYFDPFLTYEGKLCVDYIGKMETIQEDYNRISSIASLPNLEVPNIKSHYFRHKNYMKYYKGDKNLIERVRWIYRPEVIEYLGYDYGK